MPTTSFCSGCRSVQPLRRAYWWDLLAAWCGTCLGCGSDLVVRPAPPREC